MIRRRRPPVPPVEGPVAPPALPVVDKRHTEEHPEPHPMFRGVCICGCKRCTDWPAKDVTRCICPDCDPKRCGARTGVRVNGDRVSQTGYAG